MKNLRIRKNLLLSIAYGTDYQNDIKIVWYNQKYIGNQVKKGVKLALYGEILTDKQGIYISNPLFEILDKDLNYIGHVMPIYSLSKGITQKVFQSTVKNALKVSLS